MQKESAEGDVKNDIDKGVEGISDNELQKLTGNIRLAVPFPNKFNNNFNNTFPNRWDSPPDKEEMHV